jgi:hypothetical protein
MEKEFIKYEQALALKELGFNELCLNKFYTKPNSKMFGIDEKARHYPIKNTAKNLYTIGEHFVLKEDNVIIAPLYQQAFRWFREKYNLFGQVNIHTYFIYNISNDGFEMIKQYDKLTNTYEEAELDCLIKLIEIVKNG